MREKVLQLLNGSDSGKPISLSELTRKSTLPESTLLGLLDELYDVGMINRATVTQGGLTSQCVWQTGITPKIRFGQYIPQPLPTGTRKPEVSIFATKIEEKPMEQQPKTKTQMMLDLLIEKGSVISADLCRMTSASGVKPFLGHYMERGLVMFEETPKGKVYSIAPGVTPEQLRKKGTTPSPRPLPNTAPAFIPPPTRSIEAIPAAGTEPAATILPPIVVDVPETIGAAVAEPVIARVAQEKPRFRLAITSDKTLMLFGLTPEALELDAEQTQTLMAFSAEMR